jgi:uncharacterized protein YdaU (DUF1376 family)
MEEPIVKSPAFQVYPNDFLADPNTLVMSTIEIGAYWLLILVCWKQDGLPAELHELASIARLSEKKFQAMWEQHIERCFQKRADGKWTHKRLEKERAKQAENRAKRQEAGRKGAKAKWQTDGNAIAMPDPEPNNGNGKRIAMHGLSDFSLQTSVNASANAKEKRDELFESLASVCRIDWKLCTAEQRGALNQTLGILRKEGHTALEVRQVGEWWFASDWRGRQGQAPRPDQIREVWQQAFMPTKVLDEHPNAYRKGKMVY